MIIASLYLAVHELGYGASAGCPINSLWCATTCSAQAPSNWARVHNGPFS